MTLMYWYEHEIALDGAWVVEAGGSNQTCISGWHLSK